MTAIIDCDQHLYESRTMWSDHMEPSRRADALRIEDDELGYPWLMWRDQRIELADVHLPGIPFGDDREPTFFGWISAHRRWLGLALLVALPFRLWVALHFAHLSPDGVGYEALAENLAQHGVFSLDGPPTCRRGTAGAASSRRRAAGACIRWPI